MWCSRPKNKEITKRKTGVKPVKSRKTGTSQFFHKIISTHLLTALIISVIVQLEQKERKKEKIPATGSSKANDTSDFSDRANTMECLLSRKGDMTYVDA